MQLEKLTTWATRCADLPNALQFRLEPQTIVQSSQFREAVLHHQQLISHLPNLRAVNWHGCDQYSIQLEVRDVKFYNNNNSNNNPDTALQQVIKALDQEPLYCKRFIYQMMTSCNELLVQLQQDKQLQDLPEDIARNLCTKGVDLIYNPLAYASRTIEVKPLPLTSPEACQKKAEDLLAWHFACLNVWVSYDFAAEIFASK